MYFAGHSKEKNDSFFVTMMTFLQSKGHIADESQYLQKLFSKYVHTFIFTTIGEQTGHNNEIF